MVADKGMYNKFYYRLGKSDEVAKHWETYMYASEEEQRAFVQKVVSSKAGKTPPGISSRSKTIVDEKEDNEKGQWMTFKAAADRDGEDLVLECIQHGTIITRPNTKLPPHTKIVHPYNLEVAYVEEGWSTKRKSTDESSHVVHHAEGDIEAEEEFEQKFGAVWSSAGVPSTTKVAKTEANGVPPAGTQSESHDCVQGARLQVG